MSSSCVNSALTYDTSILQWVPLKGLFFVSHRNLGWDPRGPLIILLIIVHDPMEQSWLTPIHTLMNAI